MLSVLTKSREGNNETNQQLFGNETCAAADTGCRAKASSVNSSKFDMRTDKRKDGAVQTTGMGRDRGDIPMDEGKFQ